MLILILFLKNCILEKTLISYMSIYVVLSHGELLNPEFPEPSCRGRSVVLPGFGLGSIFYLIDVQ